MGRRKLNEDIKRTSMTITMNVEEKAEIEKLAQDYGMSASGLFRFLVKKELKSIESFK